MDENGNELDEIIGDGYFPLCTRKAVEGVGLNEIPGERAETAPSYPSYEIRTINDRLEGDN